MTTMPRIKKVEASNFQILYSQIPAELSAITPPSLYPVHHPTTAIAAPACIDFPSSFPICSILRASTVISWVAEAIAIIRPIVITNTRLAVGSKKKPKN